MTVSRVKLALAILTAAIISTGTLRADEAEPFPLRRARAFTGTPTTDAYLDNPSNHFLAWRVDGEPSGDPARSILVLYNGHKEPVTATLPTSEAGFSLVLDTSAAAEAEGNVYAPGLEVPHRAGTYVVAARSVVVLIEGA